MKCHLCNSSDIQIFYKEKNKEKVFHYIYCNKCDLYQTYEIYNSISPDYSSLTTNSINSETIWCQGAHKEKAFLKYIEIIKSYYSNNINNFNLLDIGCGTCGFFSYLQNLPVKLYGFDASEAQVNYAKKLYPKVRKAFTINEYVNNLKETNIKFDLITLWDVVEHIRDPLIFFKDLSNFLSKDGTVFLSIPNGGALKTKIQLYKMLFKNISLDPWEHIFYYTPKSIKHYLEKCGLSVIDIGATPYYEGKISVYEICRRCLHLITSKNLGKVPQIYILAKKK